jgi:hypothetical protein
MPLRRGPRAPRPVGAAIASACALIAWFLIAVASASAATNYALGRPLAVVDHSPGNEEVYWAGAGGYLWQSVELTGQWRGPVRTPIGSLASPPAATIGPAGSDYVFWEGSDRALWEASTAAGVWSVPVRVGMGPLGSQPAATSWGNSTGAITIEVFWQGTDGNLWQAWYPFATGAWSGPHKLGMGPLGSAPTATAQGSSSGAHIQVFWKGRNNALWEGQTSGGAWSGPTSLGMGPLGSAPTVGWLPAGEEDVFWSGTNAKLWQAKRSGTSWQGPSATGIGPLASAPTVTAVWPSEQDVFWVGTDADLWQATDAAGTWTSIQSRGPMVAYPPAQTTPVPVTVAPPAPSPRERRLRVKIVMAWTWNGAHTRLRRLLFSRFPGRGTVRVSCRGRGCPRRASHAGHRNLRGLVSSLERRVFRSGQHLTITVSAPGWVPERAGVAIRDGALPTAKLL